MSHQRFGTLLLPLLLVSAIASCRAHCPTCPKPVPPAPVTVVATPLVCDLPELPSQLPDAVGFPSPDGQSIYVSLSDWSILIDHVLGLYQWIDSAAPCIEAR